MLDVQKNLSIYKHVFVLLMSWHADSDDMSVKDKVNKPSPMSTCYALSN